MRWALRQRRTWVALAAAVVAPLLAARDGRTAWTLVVTVATWSLAAAAIAAGYTDANPGRAARRAERDRARVDEIVRRYEDRRRYGDPPKHRRLRGREARQQAQVETILWRYERQRAERERMARGDHAP